MKDLAQANTDKTPNIAAVQSIVQSPTEWSSSSYGMEDADPFRSSKTYISPTVPGQNTSNLEPVTIENLQQAFGSSPQDTTGFQPSSMTAGSVSSSSIQPPYSSPNTTGMSSFPDLTTMMFPSNDPFAYPNQPMTLLENFQGTSPEQSFSSQLFADGTNNESYNNISAPLYGPLPAYSMQGTRSTNALVDRSFDGSQGWAQQPLGRFAGPPAGSGWDTIFGEDWSGGWPDPGITQ